MGGKYLRSPMGASVSPFAYKESTLTVFACVLGWSDKGHNQWILTGGILKVGF